MSDTIVAISTALGAGGVAVTRLSGGNSLNIAKQMFKPLNNVDVFNFEPYKMYVGEILCENFKDFGMCVYFKAPKSFTGEDVVEFHSHGGIAITKGIIEKALSLGARMATNGEFTKRAFINGKLSLSSAEGLIDMINSEAESGVKAGYYLYREKLTGEVEELQNKVLDVISEIDCSMDFPEEDLEFSSRGKIKTTLTEVNEKIEKLLSTFMKGRIIKNGVKVGIVGKPNTGKSSILNALLSFDKAIVSNVAGTTRDIVEGVLDINGFRFYFSDTAGIRESEDRIEEIGVSLSKKILNESDLIIFVLDGEDITKEDDEIFELVKDKNYICVLNKTDKSNAKDERANLYVSALNRENIEELKELIYNKTVGSGIDFNGDFLVEERHYEALKRAKESFTTAILGTDDQDLDLLSIDVKNGWDALGEISGKTATEEIINNIFSKFCVGK